jgi:microcystin degradation protein MlrC
VALSAPEDTVYLSDSGDNPGAGGTTDVPAMISALLKLNAPSALVAAIWDPESADACIAAGLGATVDLRIGGKIDVAHGRPLPVRATVERVGLDYALARIQGTDVLLSRHRMSIVDPAQLRSRSIEPTSYRIVVLKRGYLEPAFQSIAPRSILSLSPGCTNCDVRRLDYARLVRPIYPLDEDMSWEPGAHRP